MSNFNIELWPIARLVPFDKNAKKHSEDQIARLSASLKKFGWDQPIVVDADGVIIKGHGRRLAAMRLGMTEVPVLIRDDLTKAQADAARISDNAVASTEYDTNMLQEELRRIMSQSDIDFTADDLGLGLKDKKLLLEDVDIPDLDSIMSDTVEEIERQKTEEAEKIEAADKSDMPLHEVFGFKKVTREQGRLLSRFLVEIGTQTGEDSPLPALLAHAQGVLE